MSEEKLCLPIIDPSDYPAGTVLTIDIPVTRAEMTVYHRIAMVVETGESHRAIHSRAPSK